MAQFTMEQRNIWPGRVVRQFSKFWQVKLPCPVDPLKDIYRHAWSNKEWIAMRYLRQQRPAALDMRNSFELYWTDDTSGRSDCPHMVFTHPDDIQLPDIGIKLTDLPSKVRRELRSWITSVNYFRSLENELLARCRGVMGNPHINHYKNMLDSCVNTPNQLYRLWPDCQPVMLRPWRREIQLASMKSRLPTMVGYRVERDGESRQASIADFRCVSPGTLEIEKQRFAEINKILLLVSMAGEVPHPQGYPTIYGNIK